MVTFHPPQQLCFAALTVLMLSVRQVVSLPQQTTIYEAGSSAWNVEGNVTTLPRAQFDSSCATGPPGFAGLGDDGLPVYVLSSPQDSVSIDFSGNEIAVYGITFANNPCEVGYNPTRSILDIAGPSSTPPGMHPGDCPSPAFPTPKASCMLLAQWTGLDATASDRHRVSISTTGRKIAVLNAQVTTGTTARDGALGASQGVVSDHLASTRISGSTSGGGATTTAHRVASSASDTPLTTGFLSKSRASALRPASVDLSDASPTASPSHAEATTGPSHPDSEVPSARVVVPAVLCTAIALCVAAALLHIYRKRRGLVAAHVSPFATSAYGSSTASFRSIPSQNEQKLHLATVPHARRTEGQTDSLQAAVEGTGLSAHDLLASLDRLREQARYSQTVAIAGSDVAPPGYDP